MDKVETKLDKIPRNILKLSIRYSAGVCTISHTHKKNMRETKSVGLPEMSVILNFVNFAETRFSKSFLRQTPRVSPLINCLIFQNGR